MHRSQRYAVNLQLSCSVFHIDLDVPKVDDRQLLYLRAIHIYAGKRRQGDTGHGLDVQLLDIETRADEQRHGSFTIPLAEPHRSVNVNVRYPRGFQVLDPLIDGVQHLAILPQQSRDVHRGGIFLLFLLRFRRGG